MKEKEKIESENMEQPGKLERQIQTFLFDGHEVYDRVVGRPIRVDFGADGKKRIACESCLKLSKTQRRVEDPPREVMVLGPENDVIIDSGQAYLIGPPVICQWCKDIPKRAAKREAEEIERQKKQPQPPRHDIVQEAVKEGEKKYGGGK